jgi:hypothetical protein
MFVLRVGVMAIVIVSNPLRLARTMGRELLAGFFTPPLLAGVVAAGLAGSKEPEGRVLRFVPRQVQEAMRESRIAWIMYSQFEYVAAGLAVCSGAAVFALGGEDDLVRLLARVHALHPDSCELWIAGDGPERPRLLAQAEALGPASRHITFPGWIAPHDVHAWLQEADALLVPSTWQEPFGLVAVQGAFAACPVIASNVGGLAEIVRHGGTGWLIPHSDPDALATTMTACMTAPEAARSVGASARQQALAHFSIERCRADYERLYNSPRSTPGSFPTHENPLLV